MHATTAGAVPRAQWARTGDTNTWVAAAGTLMLAASRQAGGTGWDWRVYRAGSAQDERAVSAATWTPGPLQREIDSFELHLLAELKSAKTVRTYTEAARWLAGAALLPAGISQWDKAGTRDVQRWIASLNERYSGTYANNQFRALQQFFKWRSADDPAAARPNPMAASSRRRPMTKPSRSSPRPS